MKNKNILLIGSNFARKHHLIQIKKFFDLKNITICGTKPYRGVIEYFKNYNLAISSKKYDYISCATTPKKQNQILNYLIKNKVRPRGIILEKPILLNQNLIKFIKYCKKNNVKFYVNFTFANLTIFQKLSKIIKKRKVVEIKYNLNLEIKKNKNSWKNKVQDGGGFVNYYLIHFVYILVCNFNYLKLLRIKKYNKNQFLLTLKNLKILIYLNINLIKKKDHLIELLMKDNSKIILFNKSNNWFGNFTIYKKSKKFIKEKLLSKQESIGNATYMSYKTLFSKNYNINNFYQHTNFLIKTLNICNKSNIIIKNDNKKM